MSLSRLTRPDLASHEQGKGAAASGFSQTSTASNSQKTP
jgi:hypothetical protein